MAGRLLVASALALAAAAPVHAAPAKSPSPAQLAELARDVDRAESVRAVKDLQRTYSQFAQFGLWQDLASLFAKDGVVNFGSGADIVGREALAAGLKRALGPGGLKPGEFHIQFIEHPLVNLAPDGEHAKGRWYGFHLLSDGKGGASIRGGVYENEYVREFGRWKIAAQRFTVQYEGPYESGWTNRNGEPIGLAPYHFDADESGKPDLGAAGAVLATKATPGELGARIQALVDEQNVRNLQNAYGYYVDRRMWDDVVDLFAADGTVEVSGIGLYKGKSGVRRAMERMGPQGLAHGVLNEHIMMDTVVTVLPGGREAVTRGLELGLIGDGDKDQAHWEVTTFSNRFVKEDGIWKLRELRLFPHLRSDYADGWGKSRLVEPQPAAAQAPDVAQAAPSADEQQRMMPDFADANPATGTPVVAPAGYRLVATTPLTGTIAAPARGQVTANRAWLAEQRRKLAMARAWDGAENVSTAYGMYLDDFQWPSLAAIHGDLGSKQTPFAGYYIGRERIAKAASTQYGPPPTAPRAAISFHWLLQPVINVARDGRSASARTRLFQPRTQIAVGQPGQMMGAGLHGGMYNNQMYLERGTWRIWNLTLDEHYFESNGWKLGWSGMKDKPAGEKPKPSILLSKFPPDILLTDMGKRQEHFRGGTGETWAWPQILPMWFPYLNPVSGRRPENFQADCGSCEIAPTMRLTAHGYQKPPVGPVKD